MDHLLSASRASRKAGILCVDVSDTLLPHAAGRIPVSMAPAGRRRCYGSPGWMLAQCLESWQGWEVLGRAHLGKAGSRECRDSLAHPSSLHTAGERGSCRDCCIVPRMTALGGEMSPGRGGCVFLEAFHRSTPLSLKPMDFINQKPISRTNHSPEARPKGMQSPGTVELGAHPCRGCSGWLGSEPTWCQPEEWA